jgi:hypothetical protein
VAVGWYRRAAEGGDIAAQLCLGECHEHGEGVAADASAAYAWYERAAQAGEPHALAEQGRCLLHGIGTRGDVRRGERLLRAATEAGWQPALGELERYWFAQGERHFFGRGVPNDAQKAVAAYRKAAELGHKRAALMLGECCRHGHGTAPAPREAQLWLLKAAALFDAKVALADFYFFGQPGFPANPREAFRWYEQAAQQQDDAYVMYSLGWCLLHGHGVRRDVGVALRWLRRAAQLGDAAARYELGCAYLRGAVGGVKRRLAVKWLRAAAELGHAEARAYLDRVVNCETLN